MSFLRRLFHGSSSAKLPGEPAGMTARVTDEGGYCVTRGDFKGASQCFRRANTGESDVSFEIAPLGRRILQPDHGR